MLEIKLFGPPDVRVDGKQIRTRTRKGLWILALLTLRATKEVAREWLDAMLWPDSEANQPGTNLRRELSNLRNVLGTEAYRLESKTSRILQLDLTDAKVDLIEFDQRVSDVTNLPALEYATSLYNTGLLEGCSEPWVTTERLNREQLYIRALMILAEKAIERGEHRRATDYLKKLTLTNYVDQEVHRRVMEVCRQSRQYDAALDYFQKLSQDLEKFHGSQPDIATYRLYEEIRNEARRLATKPPRRDLSTTSSSVNKKEKPQIEPSISEERTRQGSLETQDRPALGDTKPGHGTKEEQSGQLSDRALIAKEYLSPLPLVLSPPNSSKPSKI